MRLSPAPYFARELSWHQRSKVSRFHLVDTKIHTHKVYLPGEALEYTLSGGGGTDFRPLFTYVDATIDHPTALLFFTDGKGTFPETDPHYDVMWVMPEQCDMPFGEVLVLE